MEAALGTGVAHAEGIASEIGMSPGAGVETGMPSAAETGDTTDRMRAPIATAVPPAWDLEAAEAEALVGVVEAAVVVVAAAGAGKWPRSSKEIMGARI